jgi:hypothetical protein
MGYKLFLDDERNPPDDSWITCRSSEEAISLAKSKGSPDFMSLDHDLGGDDTVMKFLKRFVSEVWDGDLEPPKYKVHSANPVGAKNIISFMESWIKSLG